ncbi:MAG: glycosyltransferase family 2 protein [bacterium]|nr:glycosyltransferase family 2 protein [bacterium]
MQFIENEPLLSRRRQTATDLVALIPAYQAEQKIMDVVTRTRRHVSRCIVVDDGSRDRTGELARRAGAEVITHVSNRGKGAAIRSGLTYLRNEEFTYCILLDADGQHEPHEIPKLVEAAKRTHADIVCGTRMGNPQGMPWLRRMTNRIMSRLTSWLCGIRLSDTQCGFRLLSKHAVSLIELRKDKFEVETEILVEAARHGLVVTETPVASIYAANHSSHIHPVRDTVRFLKLVTLLLLRRLLRR